MQTTCIEHPTKQPLIVIHAWQLALCDGNQCAAALLSFFEYWHNIRLVQAQKAKEANDVAEQHGDKRTQDESLWQWHTTAQLARGTLIFRRNAIAAALKLLEAKQFIRLGGNPSPRYAFDRTRFILFDPDQVNTRLRTYTLGDAEPYLSEQRRGSADAPKKADPSAEKGSRSTEKGRRSAEKGGAIPKITAETTKEITDLSSARASRAPARLSSSADLASTAPAPRRTHALAAKASPVYWLPDEAAWDYEHGEWITYTCQQYTTRYQEETGHQHPTIPSAKLHTLYTTLDRLYNADHLNILDADEIDQLIDGHWTADASDGKLYAFAKEERLAVVYLRTFGRGAMAEDYYARVQAWAEACRAATRQARRAAGVR